MIISKSNGEDIKKIARHDRKCTVCKVIDDEIHFFFNCSIGYPFFLYVFKYENSSLNFTTLKFWERTAKSVKLNSRHFLFWPSFFLFSDDGIWGFACALPSSPVAPISQSLSESQERIMDHQRRRQQLHVEHIYQEIVGASKRHAEGKNKGI